MIDLCSKLATAQAAGCLVEDAACAASSYKGQTKPEGDCEQINVVRQGERVRQRHGVKPISCTCMAAS